MLKLAIISILACAKLFINAGSGSNHFLKISEFHRKSQNPNRRCYQFGMAFLSNTGRVRVRTRRLLLHACVRSRRLLLHLRDRSRSILSFFKRLIAETPFQTSATDRADYFSNTGVWSPGIDRQVQFLWSSGKVQGQGWLSTSEVKTKKA